MEEDQQSLLVEGREQHPFASTRGRYHQLLVNAVIPSLPNGVNAILSVGTEHPLPLRQQQNQQSERYSQPSIKEHLLGQAEMLSDWLVQQRPPLRSSHRFLDR
jgi:hypothetical protein